MDRSGVFDSAAQEADSAREFSFDLGGENMMENPWNAKADVEADCCEAAPEFAIRNSPSDFSLRVEAVDSFNLAVHQSRGAIVHNVAVKCLKCAQGASETGELVLRVYSDPPLVTSTEIRLGRLIADQEVGLESPELPIGFNFLAGLREKVQGSLFFQILEDGEERLTENLSLEILAYDQWLGYSILPETTAALVTPNVLCVRRLLQKAGGELQLATGSSSILGYGGGRQHVMDLCAALYRAVQSLGITYVTVPPSFGQRGQKVRLASTVVKERVGDCLDVTLLFASCLEACALHPLLIFIKGHAFVGCHVQESSFPVAVNDDCSMLRKLAGSDDILVWETTCTGSNNFSQAEQIGLENLADDERFLYALDVVRARSAGVQPLPMDESDEEVVFYDPGLRKPAVQEDSVRTLSAKVDLDKLEVGHSDVPARVQRWQRKLLDLSLRNKLLNMRDGKNILPLCCPRVDILEDKLAGHESLSLGSLANLLDPSTYHEQISEGAGISAALNGRLGEELNRGRLWSPCSVTEVRKRLKSLMRQAKSDLEEGGVNTIFVAVGVLEWKASARDERPYRAPILLMPVKLVQRSIAEGARVTRLDEETVVNVTLLEMLHRDYRLDVPGLVPLPGDEHGVDVPRVLNIFREAVKPISGFEVKEEAILGYFYFGKFMLWHDMTNRLPELQASPLVRHLIEGKSFYDDGVEVFEPSEVRRHIDYANLYCPLSADSSQLAAVLYSAPQQTPEQSGEQAVGKSFVLHGPPGTGKSQTITNIIAHNLALGRRVLFVSEKKAALDVVHKRLTNLGLGPFCLELHSNKSGKTEVLQQFAKVLAVQETSAPGDWDSVVSSLEAARGELNDYVSALHHVYPNGLSAYKCLADADTLAIVRSASVEWDCSVDFLTQSEREWDEMHSCWQNYLDTWKYVLPEDVASFKSWLNASDWSPVYEREILHNAREFLEAGRELEEACNAKWAAMLPGAKLEYQCSLKSAQAIMDLMQAISGLGECPDKLRAGNKVREQVLALLKRFHSVNEKHRSLVQQLSAYDLEAVRSLDCGDAAEKIRRHNDSFIVVRIFKESSLLKEFAGLKKPGKAKLTLSELERNLPKFESYDAVSAEYGEVSAALKEILGSLWHDGAVNDEEVGRCLERAEKLGSAVRALNSWGLAPSLCAQVEAQSFSLAASVHGQENAKAGLEKEMRLYGTLLEQFRSTLERMASVGKGFTPEAEWHEMVAKVCPILEKSSCLRDILRYLKARKMALCQGVGGLVFSVEAGKVQAEALASSFTSLCRKEMLEQILAASPALSHFTGISHNKTVERFRSLDERYTKLTKELIFAKLAARLPRRRVGAAIGDSELSILKRECEKKARQMAVRTLLERLPNMAGILKPCFLMSPLSVAQYLPPSQTSFDLIVFDEASQIPVWDAVGVIARGRQLIVVGDPKQMPPTSFFQKGDGDEEDLPEGELTDMESILDECLAAGVHSAYLNWHYRSRDESLITFSNHHYYQDSLLTFPAAGSRVSEHMGVSARFVENGIFGRKGQRTNPVEAAALVSYLCECLRNPLLRRRSYGVVTFSQSQKDLIEDMLEEERLKDPGLDSAFVEGSEGELFVKNLENVQGDERDVILFSIAYAPDASGSFAMNFGPLNKVGGERRLNVAVTRAKEQVVVFTSIRSTQIDLNRTQAKGALHLKQFLEFAETGRFLGGLGSALGQRKEQGLNDLMASVLEENGYRVRRNVGLSSYRIDLAVCHPQDPERYVVAVECDGPAYAAQRTVRDRDSLRGSVLASLGWSTYRAWSIDWAFDRERAQAHLLEFVAEACRQALARDEEESRAEAAYLEEQSRALAEQEEEARRAAEARAADMEEVARGSQEDMPAVQAQVPGVVEPHSEPLKSACGHIPETVAETAEEQHSGDCALREQEPALPPPSPYQREYALWEGEVPYMLQRGMEEVANRSLVIDHIRQIIDREAPIFERVLSRRLISAWGIRKLTARQKEFIHALIPPEYKVTTWPSVGRSGEEDAVIWNAGQDPADYRLFRVGSDDASRRALEDIPPEELANILYDIVEDVGYCSDEELYKEALRTLGLKALTAKSREILSRAHDCLHAREN